MRIHWGEAMGETPLVRTYWGKPLVTNLSSVISVPNHMCGKTFHCEKCLYRICLINSLLDMKSQISVITMKIRKKHRRSLLYWRQKRFPCDQCQKSFSIKNNLKSHRRTLLYWREKHFPCDQCQQSFPIKNNLKTHRRTLLYWIENHFSCDQCQKSFTVAGDLKKHREIHTEKKPFPCD